VIILVARAKSPGPRTSEQRIEIGHLYEQIRQADSCERMILAYKKRGKKSRL
jgi:hypothetical protein